LTMTVSVFGVAYDVFGHDCMCILHGVFGCGG
jgi:hypothetical protein